MDKGIQRIWKKNLIKSIVNQNRCTIFEQMKDTAHTYSEQVWHDVCTNPIKPKKTIMKKVSKQLAQRINDINEMMSKCNELGLMATTYAGGTFPYQVNIRPIVVSKSGQFVTIQTADASRYDYISKERFNVNDTDSFSFNGLTALKYSLNCIKRALEKELNNQ